MTADNNERFIDVENAPEKFGEQQSYESIVVKQISECVKILSKPIFTSLVSSRRDNSTTTSLGDCREEVINSVDTLKILMSPFLDESSEAVKVDMETQKYIDDFGERIIIEQGSKVKIKDSKNFNQDSSSWSELFNFKVKQSRKLFQALVKSYHLNKSRLAEFSQE